MRTILSTAFSLISLFCFSQNGNYEIQYSKEPIGKSLSDKEEILSECFTFPKRIEKLTFSGNPKEIAVYLRGVSSNGKWLDNKGDYIQYDLKEKAIRWSKKFSYNKGNWYTQSDSIIVFTSGFRSWLLDYNSGKSTWKSKNDIYYIQPNMNIGIAHGFSGTYGGPLIRGIDLENGKEVWNEELANNKGWDDFIFLDDSTALLVSKGITLLNLKKGKVWQNTDIVKSKEPDSYTKQSFNFYKSLITGNFSKYQKEYNAISNESKVLVDSSSVFIINRNIISSISKENGSLNWKVSISSHYGNMSIREDKDNFYIFQKNLEEVGNPSCRILCVSKLKGKITFEKQFSRLIGDYRFRNDILYFISNGEIYKCNTSTTEKESVKNYSDESVGDYKFFVQGNKFYQNQDGILKPLENENEKKIILLTVQKNVVELNDDLSIKSILDGNDLFLLKIDSENYKVVNKNNVLFLLNGKGKVLAELNISKNAFIENDMVFDWDDNVLNVIDLGSLNIE